MTSPRIVAAALFAPIVLAACGGGHHAESRASVDQRALVVLRQLARCVRAHGIPSFPDPQVGGDGVPRLPDSAPRVPPSTQQQCRTITARIPPDYTSTTPVSTDDFQKLLQLARCIRQHGIPDWPDPNRLGEFPIDQHIQQGGKRLFVPAVHACARLNPDPNGGIHVVRAQPAP
jgi:hypothetical protein